MISESPFDKGRKEFEVLAGAFFCFHFGNADRPDYDFATGSLRMGWMLGSPEGEGMWRGNFEFLVEAFGGGVINGPGDALFGGSVLLRYNFVQADATLVPYLQLGGGGLWNDAYKDRSQRAIGAEFEFNLQGAFGVRFLVNSDWAIMLEAGYIHISNAGLADRNMGVNALGGRLGASCLF